MKWNNISVHSMGHVKDLFWGEEDAVLQLHPPKSEYVNNHPFCLHLWRNPRQKIELTPRGLI